MIQTERLLLRPHVLDDFEAVLALNSDARAMQFISDGKPATPEECWMKLLRNAGHWALLGYGLFAVIEKATGAYIGNSGLADFHRELGEDFDPYPEAGWAFTPSVHGKGFAFEAAEAAHAWMVQTHAPKRTVCIIDPGNAPSIRLAERLGYVRYGEAPYKDKTVIKFEKTAFS